MKIKLNPIVLLGALALVVVAIASETSHAGKQSCCAAAEQQRFAQSGVQAKQFKDKQTATVVINNGYTPGTIEVKLGKPVELTFVAGKEIGCGGTVMFPSLNLSKTVTASRSVEIKFTPKAAGTISFTCGMGMLQGKVIVK